MTESNHSASSKLVRDVVALGKKYSKTGFPNPNREGCPSSSSLRAMAYRDRRLTLEDLPVSHVVSCSPCFQEYAQFRRMSVLVRGIQDNGGFSGRTRRLVRSGAICLEFHSRARRVEHFAGTPSSTATSCRGRAGSAAYCSACDDCRSGFILANPRRGANDSEKKIHLPQKLLRVSFLLPIGMEPGEYAIRLQDSAGTVFNDKRAVGRLNDGITSVEVDYRSRWRIPRQLYPDDSAAWLGLAEIPCRG